MPTHAIVDFPETISVIEAGIERGLHHGVQLYVSHQGRTIADFAHGENQPGEPLIVDHRTLWLSAGKPLTVVALLQFWEQQRFDLNDRVADYLPEFGQGGKESLTIRHLLTHTCGFRPAPEIQSGMDWDQVIQAVCGIPLEADWSIGQTAGYHPMTSWFILGELVARFAEQPFSEAIRERVCLPLGMGHTFNGVAEEELHELQKSIGIVYRRERGKLERDNLSELQLYQRSSPGGNTRGPIRELGWFYESLLNLNSEKSLLTPQSVKVLTDRQREGEFDLTFQHVIDFGLGVILDSQQYGPDTLPYSFGPLATSRAFGHGGAQSSNAFADPETGLVVAYVANGMAGEPQHQKRNRALLSALATDLEQFMDLQS